MSMPSANPPQTENITQLLMRIRAGDQEASHQLMSSVYGQLKRLAGQICNEHANNPTLGPTAIVHECFVKLTQTDALASVEDRQHLFALACRVMRQVIVDYARSKQTEKRGGNRSRLELDAILDYFYQRRWDVFELNDALNELESEHARKAEVVHLKFFGGMTTAEIASSLSVSIGTVEGDWRFARAYLRSRMGSTR